MATKPAMAKLSPPERSRTYYLPGGLAVQLNNVTAVGVSDSGTHRLELGDGSKFIIPPGWLYIKLDVDDWTF
jgi:hypothetical protein